MKKETKPKGIKTMAELDALIARTARRHGYVTKRLLYMYSTQYAVERVFPNNEVFQKYMAKKFPKVATRQQVRSAALKDAILELIA